ncbi:calcium binding EGF domain-containing protein [Cryptosporidium andersoni]|uniref:Calcium binding EGF domain-containing protein n=1 Tax=Cryptosporidium andersoni TaxID=117008 RepID=A0A1J4MTL5_9CRYT|nr:calcium binding EGF domain-containing protein [Cryptosporidium andersoni]
MFVVLLGCIGLLLESASSQGLNACTIGNNPCVPNAECYIETLFVGAPKCRCPNGFEGDGLLNGTGCRDVDECILGIDSCDEMSQHCINKLGGYECECKQGYRTHEQRQNECVDIDECVELSACPSSTICINTEGSFRCECLDRNLIFELGRCRAINKCKDYNGKLNDCSQLCISGAEGQGECSCKDGYRLHDDGKTCIDIDECFENNPCDLSISSCLNIPGSYICDCFRSAGYVTSPYNSKICINVNECEEDPMICGDLNMCCKDLAPPDKYLCLAPIQSVGNQDRQFREDNGIATDPTVKSPNYNNKNNGEFEFSDKVINDEHDKYSDYDVSDKVRDDIGDSQARNRKGNSRKKRSSENQGLPDFPTSMSIQSCYDSDIEYPGYTLQVVHSLMTPFDCQLQCQIDAGCDYFTYDMLSRTCLLKAAKVDNRNAPGMISGPKFCRNSRKTPTKFKYLHSNQQSYSAASAQSTNSSSSLLRRSGLSNFAQAVKANHSIEAKCPAGFRYAQDIWREQKNKRTMEVIQRQFGSRLPTQINPSDITQGIQSNSQYMADQLTQWYEAITSVPNVVNSVARNTSALSNIPISNSPLDLLNTNPGFIAGGIPPPPRPPPIQNSNIFYSGQTNSYGTVNLPPASPFAASMGGHQIDGI